MDRSNLEALQAKCQGFADENRWHKIVELLEALPEDERCPETDNELARAYNALCFFDADGNMLEDEDINRELERVYAKKAVDLLKPHEEYFNGDHCWNYRLADAYYSLEQKGRALHYFTQALEGRPGDEDTNENIERCRKALVAPVFRKSFQERTEEAWDAFINMDEKLRQLIDKPKKEETGEKIIALCDQALGRAFFNMSYEVGFAKPKYQLILSAEGERGILFELVYFKAHAPKSVLEHWDILIGRGPSHGCKMQMYGQTVSAKDVQTWVEHKDGDDHFEVSVYCPPLLSLLKKNENQVSSLLMILTDQVIGEVAAMALISDFQVLNTPKEEAGILLSDLPKYLEELGVSTDLTAEEYLERFTEYKPKAVSDSNAPWRADVYMGSTRNPNLISDYVKAENDLMDAYQENGIVAGFLIYSMESFSEGEGRETELKDFRESLKNAISERLSEDVLTFIGDATGLYYGYVDFMLWGNLWELCDAAKEVFENSSVHKGAFCTFRHGIDAIISFGGSPERF